MKGKMNIKIKIILVLILFIPITYGMSSCMLPYFSDTEVGINNSEYNNSYVGTWIPTQIPTPLPTVSEEKVSKETKILIPEDILKRSGHHRSYYLEPEIKVKLPLDILFDDVLVQPGDSGESMDFSFENVGDVRVEIRVNFTNVTEIAGLDDKNDLLENINFIVYANNKPVGDGYLSNIEDKPIILTTLSSGEIVSFKVGYEIKECGNEIMGDTFRFDVLVTSVRV